MNVLPEHVGASLSRDHRGQQRTVSSPGTKVTDDCKTKCGCWEENQGPLEEQGGLQDVGPSLQPSNKYCFVFKR